MIRNYFNLVKLLKNPSHVSLLQKLSSVQGLCSQNHAKPDGWEFKTIRKDKLPSNKIKVKSKKLKDKLAPSVSHSKPSPEKAYSKVTPIITTIKPHIRSSNLRAAIIISQAEDLLQTNLCAENLRQLLIQCISFLKSTFPDWRTCQNEFEAETLANAIRPDSPRQELKSYLLKAQLDNSEYAVFLDACFYISDIKSAKKFIDRRRAESRSPYGLSKSVFIYDIAIYELLASLYTKTRDYKGIVTIFKWIEEDAMLQSEHIYLCALECLGRMPNASYQEVDKILTLMSANGINVSSLLANLCCTNDELNAILTAVVMVNPDFRLDPPSDPAPVEAQSIEATLRACPLSGKNANAGSVTTDDLKARFDRQLQHERDGGMLVEPISLLENSKVSKKKVAKVKAALAKEREIWRKNLSIGLNQAILRLEATHTDCKFSLYPFLRILPKEKYVEILLEETDNLISQSEFHFVASSILYSRLGQRVGDIYKNLRKTEKGTIDQIRNIYNDYVDQMNTEEVFADSFRGMWNHAQDENKSGLSYHKHIPSWSLKLSEMIGRKLYDILYEQLRFNIKAISPGKARVTTPAFFEVVIEYPDEIKSEIKAHPTLIEWYRIAGVIPLRFLSTELPMVCPPIPWLDNCGHAGYIISSSYATYIIRHASAEQINYLNSSSADFPVIFDALNSLAACPWTVNTGMLDLIVKVFTNKGSKNLEIAIPDTECPAPPKVDRLATYQEKCATFKEIRELTKQKAEMRSLWASELYRLSIANKFRDEVFWFPYSMDFRSRVYPCPPHFNHMGSDISRSILQFAKGKPLGESGLYWLKIHLVNMTGLKKRASNAERLAFAEDHISDIFDSADNPLNGRGWWQNDEGSWQTLACCVELTRALRHEQGPERYVSKFPVHQDGSCNGLQHYAALGRDEKGAHSVNLTDLPVPQDVYGDVVDLVETQRSIDAEKGVEVARLLKGFVRRKVIKQSVMTTVYGVTHYGAREQIARQLRYLEDFPSEWVGKASAYLASATLGSISKIFTSSTEIQNWFAQLAHYTAKERSAHVPWLTALGMPVSQPYSQRNFSSSFPRRLCYWNLSEEPNPLKQKNAFPPNFVHSLDSTHMMLTAVHCYRAGITFASVHDCFWTHASTVDVMNKICREEFIALHSQPILENLSEYLNSKFAYTERELDNLNNPTLKTKALHFNKLLKSVPKRGNFNLNDVMSSTYFFS